MNILQKHRFSIKASLSALAMALALSGCAKLGISLEASSPDTPVPAGGASVEKDVERPDVFSVSEKALWDGRPSLGGVWVAYPVNIDPERVIIRNIANGKSVIGALFRRERENPGPSIQLSSDAASALGVVAGTPVEISITVLRRETIEIAPPPAPEAETVPAPQTMDAPPRRAVMPTPAPAPTPTPASAPSAPVTTGAGIAAIVEQTLADVPLSTEPAKPVSRLRKPYIQVESFADEERAQEVVTLLGEAGVEAEIRVDDSIEPPLYRVVTALIITRRERTAQLRIIKGLGFTDAVFIR